LINSTDLEPENEWIEIFNDGDCEIDLQGYKLGDEETQGQGESMFTFPGGSKLKPRQAAIIANQATAFSTTYGFLPDYEFTESSSQVANMNKYTPWAGGNINLANSGDEVLILDSADKVVDSLSWGTSHNGLYPPLASPCVGCSFERYTHHPDIKVNPTPWEVQHEPNPGQVQFHPRIVSTDIVVDGTTPTLLSTKMIKTSQSNTSSTSTPVPIPFKGQLYISEVVYDCLGDEPEEEWVELYNPSNEDIDLSNFKIGDEEQIGGSESMYKFSESARIPAGQTVIIAVHAASFRARYGINPDFEILPTNSGVPVLNKYNLWANGAFSLSNSGDEVILLDKADKVIDILSWGNSDYAFSADHLTASSGCSLERSPANVDTNMVTDWREQCKPGPGMVDLIKPTPSLIPTGTISPTSAPTLLIGKSPTAISTLTPTLRNTSIPTVVISSTFTSSPAANTAVNATPTPDPSGGLVISQVLFWPAPISGNDVFEPADEWIELYNPENYSVDLSQYKVGDAEVGDMGEGMFIFPPGTRIEPGETVIIANQADRFKKRYNKLPDYEILNTDSMVPDMVKSESWYQGTILLLNQGDEVFLLDSGDSIQDYLSWGTSHFQLEPPVLQYQPGQSVVRCPVSSDPHPGINWKLVSDPVPWNPECQ